MQEKIIAPEQGCVQDKKKLIAQEGEIINQNKWKSYQRSFSLFFADLSASRCSGGDGFDYFFLIPVGVCDV